MKTIKIYISALLLMVCSAVNAQKAEPYLNVEVKSGVYKSYPVTPNLKVSWGQAKVTTGKAKALVNNKTTDVNWVQLWAGGPKWATYNVGVTDGKAENYGGYYSWGGSQDKNTSDYNSGSITFLSGTSDTATKVWGANWRMPTYSELCNLKTECTITWEVNYNNTGIPGIVVKGKGDYAENSIFLPAAGYWTGSAFTNQGTKGYYWSSNCVSAGGNANYILVGDGSESFGWNTPNKNRPRSVRAVLAE